MLHFLTQLALSPVLIPQAIGVVRRALRLPEAAGPRSGTLGSGPPLSLLIVGDSSAAGVGVDTQKEALAGQLAALLAQDFTVTWQLHAKTGATTRSTLKSLRRLLPFKAEVIVTALGVNDVTHATPYPLWMRSQRRLLHHLQGTHRPHHIYVTAVPPLGSFPLLPNPLRWSIGRQAMRFDTALSQHIATMPGATHVALKLPMDTSLMAKDGFHPSPAIYAVWAKEMASRIISDWPSFKTER